MDQDLYTRLVSFVKAKFHSRPQISGMAGDIVSEAIALVWPLEPQQSNFGYLSKVCIHAAYKCFKRMDTDHHRLCAYDEAIGFVNDESVIDEIIAADDVSEILASLDTLKRIERVIILQRYYGDFSFAQIAEANNIKLNTVLSHHRRALEKLRTRLVMFGSGRFGTYASGIKEDIMKAHEIERFGVYAERMYRYSYDLMLQAGGMGEFGEGMAIVAFETRNIANKLLAAVAQLKSNPKQQPDSDEAIPQLRMLIVNAMLEAARATDNYTDGRPPARKYKEFAVIFNEIDATLAGLLELFGMKPELPAIMPRVSRYSRVIDSAIGCLLMTIGGVDFVENVRNINEVVRGPVDISDGILKLRSLRIPIIDCHKILSLPKPDASRLIVIVNTGYDGDNDLYAIPVDNIPQLLSSKVGISSIFRADAIPKCGLTADMLREVWDCEEERQMLFLDYNALIK